jgi:formylmethanofuran dehydrogenase subunit E
MNEKQLETAAKDAVKLHGHLGPFLVIGVRVGAAARRILAFSSNEGRGLRVTVKVPLRTPYSCVLDGIQSTTQCTIGNGRMEVLDSPREIVAEFHSQNSKKALIVSVNAALIDEIERELSRGTANEELAARIISTPEHALFKLKRI